MSINPTWFYRFSWLDKNKKATINPTNTKDNKCFQYAVTVELNHEEIKNDLQRIKKIKSFINNYNWEETDFQSEKHDWKKFAENNVTITVNVLHTKKKKYIMLMFQKII